MEWSWMAWCMDLLVLLPRGNGGLMVGGLMVIVSGLTVIVIMPIKGHLQYCAGLHVIAMKVAVVRSVVTMLL